MKKLLPAVTAVFLLPVALFGQRQEILQLSADIINLEQQVREIQRSLNERNDVVQGLVEQMFDRVVSLTDTMERVSTTVGEIRTSNDQLSGELRAQMRSLSADVELMDRTLEEVRAEVSTVSQQMTSLSATTEQLNSPEGLLRTAQLDLLTGATDLAREGFIDFLSTFPSSPQAADAQLGLGDSYYDAGEFEQAVIEYDILLQRYPDSARIPDALLKKGLALRRSGSEGPARDAFDELATRFPDSPLGLRAREELDAAN